MTPPDAPPAPTAPAARTVVVLGTGGTIAGVAATPSDDLGYRSAQLPVERLVAGAAGAGVAVETEQVAQIDSKDIDFPTWHRLATRIDHHLARAEVAGIVVTHGTDTMEETAYFLQRVLAPAKPVVLTGAMRPASSRTADGPRNLADAFATVFAPEAHGVLATFAGRVHAGTHLRKVHPTRLDAFSSGDAGPLAAVEAGRLQWLQDAPRTRAIGLAALGPDATRWPVVEIVVSAAGSSGVAVDALVAAGVRGLVVAATGNGTLHHAVEARLAEAMRRGVAVLRATRCGDGAIVTAGVGTGAGAGASAGVDADVDVGAGTGAGADTGTAASDLYGARRAFPSAGALTPVQARVELVLRLLVADAARAAMP